MSRPNRLTGSIARRAQSSGQREAVVAMPTRHFCLSENVSEIRHNPYVVMHDGIASPKDSTLFQRTRNNANIGFIQHSVLKRRPTGTDIGLVLHLRSPSVGLAATDPILREKAAAYYVPFSSCAAEPPLDLPPLDLAPNFAPMHLSLAEMREQSERADRYQLGIQYRMSTPGSLL